MVNDQDDSQYLKLKKEKKIPKLQQPKKKKENINKTKKIVPVNFALSSASLSSSNNKQNLKHVANQHNLSEINDYLKEQERIKKQQVNSKTSKNTKDSEKTEIQDLLLSDYIESTIGLQQNEFEAQFLWIQTILTQNKTN